MSDKSLLAKLLATENISVQKEPGIKTAMFDIRGRVLMLPIWQGISSDLEDLLIVHETGHALDTPDADTYKKAYEDIAAKIFPNEAISEALKKTVQGFLNVVEDVRIDKRQKRRYPGSRKNYLVGYKELMERDFFGTARRDINSMNFIDRLNIWFKGGNINGKIDFTPEEKVFVRKAEGLETFAEVVALTEEIYAYCKEKLEHQQEMKMDLVAGDYDNEEGDEYELDNDNDNDSNDNSFGSGDDQSGDEDEEDSSEGQGKGEQDAPLKGEGDIAANSSNGTAGATDLTNAPVSETDETFRRRSEEIVKNENCRYVYLNMPQVNWDKALHDYKKVLEDWRKFEFSSYRGMSQSDFNYYGQKMTEWKQKERDSISFLVKEFEAKKAAETYARINIAKTGVIDTNKLHAYKYNDDIFRRLTVIPKGKNHGFIMFLDWSGSMMGNLKDTMKQLFSLTLFCKQIGVPFEVYAFKDSGCESPFSYLGQMNVIGGSNLVLRNFLSSRMNAAELNFAMTMLWAAADGRYLYSDGMGGTPLNHAIMIAPKVVDDFRARHKLEIVNTIFLTDGGSNSGDGVKNEDAGTATNGDWNVRTRDRKYFYTDKVTKKTYDFHPWGWAGTGDNTNTLLRILKDRTGCNLVGFFMYEYNLKRFLGEFNLRSYDENQKKVEKFWNDNKFYPVKSAGYDEYYVIDSRSLGKMTNELKIDNTGDKKMTVKKMASEFSKFAQKKMVNRVLLRSFISRIVEQTKMRA